MANDTIIKENYDGHTYVCSSPMHDYHMYNVKVGITGSGEGGAYHRSCVPSLYCNCDSFNEAMVEVCMTPLTPL